MPRSESTNSDSGAATSAASPGKTRRGFGVGKRWLGTRKHSQGKGEKTPSGPQSPAASEKPAPMKKTLSDKILKMSHGSDNGRTEEVDVHNVSGALDEAEDDAVELPPPMKPIQDPQAVLQQVPTPAAASSTPATREQHGGSSAAGRSGEGEETEPSTPGPETANTVDILTKRGYVLHELVDTEKSYVSDLRLVCEGYLSHMQESPTDLPDGLRDRRDLRVRMIFGNIQAIYEWHRDKFLPDICECLEAPEKLGELFRRFLEKKIHLYETYCRNKPVSEHIVSEHEHYFQELRVKLGEKLLLGDLLIKPIQRMQKYQLMMEKILKYSEQALQSPEVIAALRDAFYYCTIIPKRANEMMLVSRLQGFTGSITAQGKLLLHELLQVSDAVVSNDKGKELQVFLFEQCIIFSEVMGKKNQYTGPTYNYKGHILVNKMQFEESEAQGGFIIRALQPWSLTQSVLCRVPEPRRQLWISTLSSILQSHHMFGEALVNPSAYLREKHLDTTGPVVSESGSSLRKTEGTTPSLGGLNAYESRPLKAQKTPSLFTPATPVRNEERKKIDVNISANSSAVSPTSPPHNVY